MPSIWIARLQISAEVEEKIMQRHRIAGDQVRDAVLCRRGLIASRHIHPKHGERFILSATIRGRAALVVLYPDRTDYLGDAWNLGSAYFP